MSSVCTMGIDIGSTSSKCVIMKDGKEIVSEGVVSLGAGTKGSDLVIEEVLGKAGMTFDEIDLIVEIAMKELPRLLVSLVVMPRVVDISLVVPELL